MGRNISVWVKKEGANHR